MICTPCKNGEHDSCYNIKDCPCQHRTTERTPDGNIAPTSSWGGALTKKDDND